MTRATKLWLERVVYLLEFEPTWFPELGFAIGAVGWAVFAFFTDDITVTGWAWALPGLAGVLGVVRGIVLLRLWYAARVVLTSLSALLVAWLWWGLAGRYGIVPQMAWLGGIFIIELLTAAKFSIPCLRDLRDEYRARHRAR